MSLVTVNLTVVWGRTAALIFTFTNLGSSGLNAFNDIRFTAKYDTGDADVNAVLSKTLASGITITTVGNATTNGVIQVALAPADTSVLPTAYASNLTYDVSVYDGVGDAYTTHQGTLTVQSTATNALS